MIDQGLLIRTVTRLVYQSASKFARIWEETSLSNHMLILEQLSRSQWLFATLESKRDKSLKEELALVLTRGITKI